MRTGYGRCAYLNRMTGDGRIIRKLGFREAPLPLTMKEPEKQGYGHDLATVVGKVVFLETLASTSEVFAYVEVTEDWAIPVLENVQHYMEIDIDDVSADTLRQNGEMIMDITYGRLAAIHLGENPCWPGLEFRLNP